MVCIKNGKTVQMGRLLKTPLALLHHLFLFAVLIDRDFLFCLFEVIGNEDQTWQGGLHLLSLVHFSSETVLTNQRNLTVVLGIVKHFVKRLCRINVFHRRLKIILNC